MLLFDVMDCCCFVSSCCGGMIVTLLSHAVVLADYLLRFNDTTMFGMGVLGIIMKITLFYD